MRNALAAIAVASELGVADEAICRALANFQGIDRRMQHIGDASIAGGTVSIVDDYGHHPTEIAATLEALRQAWPGRRLVLVFQPHRYTRTRDLLDDFANVLARRRCAAGHRGLCRRRSADQGRRRPRDLPRGAQPRQGRAGVRRQG